MRALNLILVLWSSFAWGAGMLVPTDQGIPPLSIRYHRVEVKIENGVSTTKVAQAFYNNTNSRLEATFIFPLPAEASISEFAMYMNGKKVQGELLESGKARAIYEDIVRRMQDPGLLEYMGNDLLKARVFPVEPRSDQRIEIEYSQVLKMDAGLYAYRYPLKTGDKASQTLEDFSVSVQLLSKVPIKTVFSPSHDVAVKRRGNAEATVGFEKEKASLDRDFELLYTVSQEDIGVNLVTHREKGEDGFFMLMVSPDQEIQEAKILAKDMTFVIDVSGSMQEEGKIDQVKQALRTCVQGLRPEDRFSVITFSTDVEEMFDGLTQASAENVAKACAQIEKIPARGGTNISDALKTALLAQSKDKRHKSIIFLTDGKPTVGTTDVESLLGEVASQNPGLRIFVFGVGTTVNTHLLDRMAEESGGTSIYVKPQQELEMAVSGFFEKASSPVLANLALDLGAATKASKIYPERLPDLYKGSQLVVFGRYKGQGDVAVRLTGDVEGQKREIVADASFPVVESGNDYLPRLWAVRRVGYILDEIRLHGENEELKGEVVDLSKQYGILTPYTSFLVVEEEKAQISQAPQPREPVSGPRPVPQDHREKMLSELTRKRQQTRDAAAAAAGAPAPAPQVQSSESFRESEGAAAVEAAKEVNELKSGRYDAQGASKDEAAMVRRVGQTTFYLSDGVWVDGRYTQGLEILKVKFGSKAYFQICEREPELKKLLSAGDRVLVVWKGKAIEIGPEGKEDLTEQELSRFLPK